MLLQTAFKSLSKTNLQATIKARTPVHVDPFPAATSAISAWGFSVEADEKGRTIVVGNPGKGACFLTSFLRVLKDKGCTFHDARTFQDGKGNKFRVDWQSSAVQRATPVVIRVLH